MRAYFSVAVAVSLLAAAASGRATADEVADFYKSKTLTLNVPAGPGTGFSLFSKLLTDHMRRSLPGNPNLIANFRPGGGGLVAPLYMANAAPRDGTELSLVLAPSVLLAILRPDQTKFDARQFTWLGSMFPRTGAVWLWSAGPATTLEQAKTVEVVLGASGIGSETYQTPQLMNVLLGTKFKITTGYRSGAEINLAIERGEVQGRQQNYLGWEAAGKHDWLRNKKVIPIIQTGPTQPALGPVPSFRDIVKPGQERELVELHEIGGFIGMGLYAPPGVPRDRAAALRKAFAETMKDPQLLAEAKRLDVVIDPVDGEAIQKIIAHAYGFPEAVRARLRDVLEVK